MMRVAALFALLSVAAAMDFGTFYRDNAAVRCECWTGCVVEGRGGCGGEGGLSVTQGFCAPTTLSP